MSTYSGPLNRRFHASLQRTIPRMLLLLFIVVFLLTPVGILWLTHHHAWARKIGIIVLCYTAGLVVGNIGLVPESVLPVQTQMTDLSIALAMPLLLFTLNVRQWRRVAGKAMLSMILATTAVVAIVTTLFFYYNAQGLESADHYAAMSVGVYTGGTPNLAAIKAGLNIPHNEYIIFHSLDTVVGGAYLLLMLTIGIPIFRAILAPWPGLKQAENAGADESEREPHHLESDDYSPLLQKSNWSQVVKALSLAVLVVLAAQGVSALYAFVFATEPSSAVMIVTITTLGILLSLLPQVSRLQLAYKLGMYLIYVFCFVVASMASLDQLAAVDMSIAVFMFVTIFGSLLLHCLLCRLLGVDADTFMVTSMAAVGSPPFVPLMARALGNPEVILSGMTTGIICYAIGNYLGITLGLLLQGL